MMPKPDYDKVTMLYVKMGKYKEKAKKHKKDKRKKYKKKKRESSSSSEEQFEKKVNYNSSTDESTDKRYSRKRKHCSEDKHSSSSSDRDRVQSKRNDRTYLKKDKNPKKTRNDYSSSSEEWVEKKLKNTSYSEDESSDEKHSHKRKHSSENKKKNSSSSDDDGVEKKINRRNYTRNKKKTKKQKKECSSSSEECIAEKVDGTSSKTSSSEDESTTNKRKRCSEDKQNSSSDDNTKRKVNSLAYTRKKSDISFSATSKESSGDKREDWMNLHTSFLISSNSNRKKERDEAKKLEREKQQYNPSHCSRELNPYWKNGGDGLPKFKKPNLDDNIDNYRKKGMFTSNNRLSNWRKIDKEKIDTGDVIKETYSVNKSEQTSTDLKEVKEKEIFSEKELNLLAAKLLKAEIMGNTKLVNELKEKLDKARSSQNAIKSADVQEKEIVLTHTDSYGRTQPVKLQSAYGEPSGCHKRKKKIETHTDGQRVRYFADDDKYSLKQMFEKEKYNSVENQNSEFVKMISKVHKNDDLDDIFADNIRNKESDAKTDSKNRERAISEHQKITKSLDNCNKCIQSESMLKHLMITLRETSYLALPSYEPLTEGHCLIIPIRHVPCSTQLDENEWTEILDIRKTLVKLFESKNEYVIFFETAVSLHRFPHMHIECIPLPKEEGDMAPIFFKKAIDESETEWANNKKLVSLKGRDVRKAVPKGLPYFSVSFGMEEGYAHVIEDEQMFPNNFAQEIIGGMLDAHHSKWKKPKRQKFEEQSKRVLEFSKEWKNFDPT